MQSDVFLGMTIPVAKRRKASEYGIKNAVKATDKDAQYDTSAKCLKIP